MSEPHRDDKDPDQWAAEDWIAEAAKVLGDDDLNSDAVLIGAAMLAAMRDGPNLRKCAKAIGVPPSRIEVMWDRLKRAGIFTGKHIHANWLDEDGGGMAFCMDVWVALGVLEVSR